MKGAYVELEYRRAGDNLPAVLIAALPTVREITVGGAPGDLRLPGTPPETVYARIRPLEDGFLLVPAEVATSLRVNDRTVPAGGVPLAPYDTISIGDYQLTVHEGEPPSDPPLIETQLRWKLRAPHSTDEEDAFDPAAKPHIDEFDLSVRPLLQARRFGEVQQRAAAELQRLLRDPEADALEGYAEYLWWARLYAAREACDAHAGEIAREAYDLYPDSGPLMVSCGLTFVTEGNLAQARSAFDRVLRLPARALRSTLHDARLGRILADHLAALNDAERARDAIHMSVLDSRGWDAPAIHVHVPGDEVLLWRVAWHGRAFGGGEHIRFVYRGKSPDSAPGVTEAHRWEIHDFQRQIAFRRVLIAPELTLADPSLVLEVAGVRSALSQYPVFANLLIDRSAQAAAETQPPVLFDPTALAELPAISGAREVAARLSQRAGQLYLHTVLQPGRGDVVYRQGRLCVSVQEAVVQQYSGAVLRCGPNRSFTLQTATRQEVPVRYRKLPIWRRHLFDLRHRNTNVQSWWVVLAVLVLLLALLRALTARGH